ncbi:MAG: hypothetical protein SLRJCFUN_000412 [Candidatus Fervidibacter sp.]
MDEQTFRISLPTGLADTFIAAMERLLKERGFQEQVRAGEVAGVEASVWQRGETQIVIAVQEADTEEALSISVKGADGVELLSAAIATLMLELLERFPAETRPSFEPFLASLKQLASRPI